MNNLLAKITEKRLNLFSIIVIVIGSKVFIRTGLQVFAYAFGGGFIGEPLGFISSVIHLISYGLIVAAGIGMMPLARIARPVMIFASLLILLNFEALFLPPIIESGETRQWFSSIWNIAEFIGIPTMILLYLVRAKWIVIAAIPISLAGVYFVVNLQTVPPSTPEALQIPGRVAFLSTRNSGREQLYVLEGTNLTQIWPHLETDVEGNGYTLMREPSFSADGKEVVFECGWHSYYNDHICIMNVDGSNLRYLLSKDSSVGAAVVRADAQFFHDPTFSSPTAEQIAFVTDMDGEFGEEIYVINSDGSNLKKLANGVCPAWFPNSQQITYLAGGSLYRRNIDSSGRQKLAEINADWLYCPEWSPDGRYLVFTSESSSDRKYDIWIFDIEDGTKRQITERIGSGQSSQNPTWSADGQWIAFESNHDGQRNPDIYIMRIDGSEIARITHNRVPDTNPFWLPN